MRERIEKELALLRQQHSTLEYREEGQWVRIPCYPLPAGWNHQSTDVVFQIPTAFPGAPPYGIYVPAGLQFKEQRPESYTEPASQQPPFGGPWGLFSWSTLDGQWRATTSPDPARGYTLLPWVRSFAARFGEGK